MHSNHPIFRSVHFAETDPGTTWQKDSWVAVDIDDDDPSVKIITPNVIRLPRGGYRMYYSALWYGTDGYEDSRAEIRSAFSEDAVTWQREPGERLIPFDSQASLRVLCPDVIPLVEGGYRMYFEAKSLHQPTVVMSAISTDGLSWHPEPGVRVGQADWSLGSPRCIYVPIRDAGIQYRLYYHRRTDLSEASADHQIVSATSRDGVTFQPETGARISQDGAMESLTVYAPEVLKLADGSYRMYYAGWSQSPVHGRVFSARSTDGLVWIKDPSPCLEFGGPYDAVKVSEPCIIDVADGRYRMFYEGSDEQGNWRILSATSPSQT